MAQSQNREQSREIGPDWRLVQTYFGLTLAHPLFERFYGLDRVWEILDRLPDWLEETLKPNVADLVKNGPLIEVPTAIFEGQTLTRIRYRLNGPEGFEVWDNERSYPGAALILPGAFISDENIEIGPGVLVESGATIKGPTILGPKTEVRQGAYIRGGVWATREAVIGHATEAKNVLMLDGAKAGHFAYLGDSVLGREVNLGAGTKLANLRMDGAPITLRGPGETIKLSRRKMGAILGDRAQTGCNSVTNPGVLFGADALLWPNQTAPSGYYPPMSRIKGLR
ncbi:MAG: hypothetical protein LBT38_05750 [Deltaproteobacteria bacterium]|jgi:acetyltransferase-like isoleucine patch superfamily enzyme|nr:hypothetical protein [Deltaproteobacteria bacterium]